MAKYKALVGMNYAGKRVEPGDIVEDIPSKSLSWLLDQGCIERADGTPTKREQESPSEGDE